ncbi:MAG: hypothetical protein EBS29_01930 [Chloroflexia bacterium]|nr:hypothetical protein [Chloroflexia bacterium]
MQFLRRCLVLSVVILGVLWGGLPTQAATEPVVNPQAALIVIDASDVRMVVVDLGMARSTREAWELPLTVQATALESSPLPRIVQQLLVPTNNRNLLIFSGAATATPAPTATAYVTSPVRPFTLGAHVDGHIVINNPADAGGQHRFVQLSCVQCASGWELTILNQLPTYAPIVVYANGRAELAGAWLIRVQPIKGTDLPALATVAHLYERLPDSPLTGLTWRKGAVRAEAFPPERFVEVDGRQQMGRVLVCLVGVLFCSLASFYIGVAVMKRMHAAVGYRPEQ